MNDLQIPPGCDDVAELRARFKITCRRCGSDEIGINIESAYNYSEYTQGGGYMQIGCNACKRNDMQVNC